MSGDTDRGSGPPLKGPYHPDRIHERMASGDTDRAVEAGLREALERSVAQWQREARGREADKDASGASLLAAGVLYRCASEVRADLASSRPAAPDSSDQLREALTDITLAHRHLLGDSDVSREDASAALVEAERTIRVALSVSPRSDMALDVAWHDAEAALPNGASLVVRYQPWNGYTVASAQPVERSEPPFMVRASGDTPAAALHALASRLSPSPESTSGSRDSEAGR